MSEEDLEQVFDVRIMLEQRIKLLVQEELAQLNSFQKDELINQLSETFRFHSCL